MSLDADLTWGGALKLNSSGDLALVSGVTYAQQRVVRRIFTGPAITNSQGQVTQLGDYPFHPSYGAGLGREVDTPDTNASAKIRKSKILQALSQEAVVDQSTPPQVSFLNSNQAQLITVQFKTVDGQLSKFTARV